MGGITYLWRIASDCPDSLIVTHDKETVDPTIFRNASPIAVPQTALFVHHGPISDLQGQDYIPNSASLPLLSVEASRRLSALAGVSVQGVRAIVTCSDGVLEAVLLNILRSISAVDWTVSKALFIPGTKQVMKFSKLQLKANTVNGVNIARLEEFRPFVLATDEVKHIFYASELCEFSPPSDIRA